MKIPSPFPKKRGRIEIIPLIDIMFFLLAAFMVVSINKIKVKSLKVALPTDVPVSQLEPKEDFVTISVDPAGQVQLDKDKMADTKELLTRLQAIYATNKDQKFLISADKDARNGDVIGVLGKLRTAGFQRVAFNLKGGTGHVPVGGAGGVEPAADATAPSSAPSPDAAAEAAQAGAEVKAANAEVQAAQAEAKAADAQAKAAAAAAAGTPTAPPPPEAPAAPASPAPPAAPAAPGAPPAPPAPPANH